MDHQHLTEAFQAGCSALSWFTEDGKHLWGRNYDFTRLAEGTGVTFLPRETTYDIAASGMALELTSPTLQRARYAALGMGFLQVPAAPVLYEGINEAGLMGGQLFYREFARFPAAPRQGTQPLQPPLLVYHLLAQCATVEEAARHLTEQVTPAAIPFLGAVPTLHWAFSDRTGEMMVVEPEADGLHIYRNTVGVMTNSPSYPWHRTNLLNYAGLRARDYGDLEINGNRLKECFSGSGCQGLPGDWSSPSRFVRLAFLRQLAVPGRDEGEGVSRMFRLFQSAAFPLGLVEVAHQGPVTGYDREVSPYDYTVYTALMCAESGTYYWNTYEDQTIRCASLEQLKERGSPCQFALSREAAFFPVAE